MATLRDIKRRIKGVQNTQQITKAMKMVAAAKLRRAQDNIINARPYAKKIFSLFNDLVTEENKLNNIFLVQREVKNVAVIVVSADRGLCGAFNTNIIKEAVRYVEEESVVNTGVSYQLYCVGKKGSDFFGKRNYNILGKNIGLFSSLKYDIALSIADEIINNYVNGKIDKVVVIYNEFKSIIQQKLVVEQYLPIPVNTSEDKKTSDVNFIYEPDQKSIFEYLLPKHLKAQLWRILLESNASELGARMTAMDNATTNAKELIRTLQLKYNKERQAAITKEILEIVSGANALKSS
ncbi:MAG: ATP synthase F1 subunit gamma [Ignavibacteriales bacterium]|nr:MAG: ATP synthase F1 subunit gamma [Ignavibacteriales bacterium]